FLDLDDPFRLDHCDDRLDLLIAEILSQRGLAFAVTFPETSLVVGACLRASVRSSGDSQFMERLPGFDGGQRRFKAGLFCTDARKPRQDHPTGTVPRFRVAISVRRPAWRAP